MAYLFSFWAKTPASGFSVMTILGVISGKIEGTNSTSRYLANKINTLYLYKLSDLQDFQLRLLCGFVWVLRLLLILQLSLLDQQSNIYLCSYQHSILDGQLWLLHRYFMISTIDMLGGGPKFLIQMIICHQVSSILLQIQLENNVCSSGIDKDTVKKFCSMFNSNPMTIFNK